MKVLLLTDRMDIGGAETHVLTLMGELIKMGCELTLLTSGGVYMNELSRMPVSILLAPTDKRDPVSISRSYKAISLAMRDCDVVHAHTRFCAFLSAKARGHASYPPIVTTAHLNFPIFPYGYFTKWGDKTLAVSEDIREYLERSYSINRADVLLTKNGINKELYSAVRQRRNLIIHTSRIDKGRSATAFALVECAPKLFSEFPDWRILIAGDGDLYPSLKAKATRVNEELGFTGVILLGKRNDIPTLLAYGKIFIGVSRAALEGMAAGLATVISGDEGYGGILSEGVINMLLRTNFCARGMGYLDNERLCEDIRLLIRDKKRAEATARLGMRTVDEYFKPSSMANDAYKAYKSVSAPPTVALVGYFGYGNLGDEETLKCAVNLLSEMGIRNICVLAKSGARLPEGTVFYNREDLDRVNECIRRCDGVIFCGGNLFQNETSARSLMYYELICEIAKRERKRVYFISSGIGEIKGVSGRYLTKRGLRTAAFLGMRTEYDLCVAKRLSDSKSAIMPDLCFLLDDGKIPSEQSCFAWFPSSKRDINVSAIKQISKARGLRPIVIMLFPEKDAKISDNDEELTVYAPKSYATLNSILSKCEFTVSERLHGAVFSLLSHTPCYLFGDSDKNTALIDEISRRKRGDATEVLLPYSLASISAKKEIGAKDSDFKYLINGLRTEIREIAIKLFQQS